MDYSFTSFTGEHRAGAKLGSADALSQRLYLDDYQVHAQVTAADGTEVETETMQRQQEADATLGT